VAQLLELSNETNTPVTFRAAGTSLSGQSVTDSVLARLVPSKWSKIDMIMEGKVPVQVKMQPGLIGGNANRVLGIICL
jgi:D-lactate dehydrogenase